MTATACPSGERDNRHIGRLAYSPDSGVVADVLSPSLFASKKGSGSSLWEDIGGKVTIVKLVLAAIRSRVVGRRSSGGLKREWSRVNCLSSVGGLLSRFWLDVSRHPLGSTGIYRKCLDHD